MKSLEKIAKGAWNGLKGLAYGAVISGAVLAGSAKEAKADFVPDRLFVGDYGANKVLEVNKNTGEFIRGIGTGENFPYDLDFGPNGDLYNTNRAMNNVHRYDDLGNLVQVIGEGYLSSPTGLDFGPDGHLYVADHDSNKIVEFDSSGNFVNSFANISNPPDVVIDSYGNMFVSDYNNGNVRKYNSNGEIITTFGEGELDTPGKIEIGPNENIFVCNRSLGSGGGRVHEYNIETLNFVRKIGDKNIGVIGPLDLAFDLENNIYISDWEDVVVYDFNGDYLRKIGGFSEQYGLAFSPIPEPATLSLLSLGSLALLGKYKKKEQQ